MLRNLLIIRKESSNEKAKQNFLSILLALCFLAMNFSALTATAVEADKVYDKQCYVDEKQVSVDSNDLRPIVPLALESLNTTECMISKYVSTEQFNKASHIERLKDEEALNTYVFSNTDGSKSVYYMDENVKYLDKNGDVIEKDISLISNDDGYGIARNEFDLHIPFSASSGISMSYNGYDVKLTPQTEIESVVAQKVDDYIIYDGFFGNNTALKYTPMLSGVKEDIIMKTYIPNAKYSFVLDTDGLSLYNDKEGYYLAKDESSEKVLCLGRVIIYDAVGKPEYGNMNVTTVTAGEKYILSLSAPEEYLADPTTVYPVTIDPTLTVSDTATGDGAIEDAVLFSNRPTRNYGDYKYLSIGYVDSTYGVGRIAVKLPGLYNSIEFQNTPANRINSVMFYCKDSSGHSAQYINLYEITSNAWDENTVTYGDNVTYSITMNWGTSLPNATTTAFDITTLARSWRYGTCDASKGFILVNTNETSDSYKKAPYSSEYTTTSYRPYVVFTYDPDETVDISNGNTSVEIAEGTTRQLTASNPYGVGYTWSSSNTSVATVSSTGMVTTHKAGEATITASFVFNAGTYSTTCTVYVYIDIGAFYIKNNNSNLYLNVASGSISNYTNVQQYSKYSDSTSEITRLRQMWRIHHLGQGIYSIRPLHKLDMGLDVTNSNVDIYSMTTTDTLSGVPTYGQWSIEWYSTGYVIKSQDSNAKTLQIGNASANVGANVVVGVYNSSSNNQRWTLTKIPSPPAGAYLYDLREEEIVSTATKTVDVGTTKSLSALQLSAVAYTGTNISQNFTWSSGNTAIATVDSNGAVTGISTGTTTITGRVYRNGAYHYVSYTLNVSGLLIYQTENTYYYDANGNYAEDLISGDMTEDELSALDWVSWLDFTGYTPSLHRADWEYMCTSLFSTGELQTVILDMIDHFMDGSGTSYSNSVLTQKAYDHSSTQTYIENVETQLENLLNTYDGEIGELAYTASTRESNPLVMALNANNVYQPVYNTASDMINGLTICVDGLWGNKIEVTSYNVSGNSYSYTLHYTLYDHFGLDQADVEKYGPLAGFRSWYVLQHYSEYDSDYKPFLTLIEFDVTVSGTFS